jgi:hypothetical protein
VGWYSKLSDLEDPARRDRVEQAVRQLKSQGCDDIDAVMSKLKSRLM